MKRIVLCVVAGVAALAFGLGGCLAIVGGINSSQYAAVQQCEGAASTTSTSGAEFVDPVSGVSLSPSGLTVQGKPMKADQAKNAAKIAGIVAARPNDFPGELQHKATVIAYVTVIVESWMKNLLGGDKDSAGLFQQRHFWGTFAQRTNVTYATNAFLNALLKVPNWQNLPPGKAAQDVQKSGYPGRYALYVPEAEKIYSHLQFKGGTQVQQASDIVDTTSCDQQNLMQQKIDTAIQACLSKVGADWQPADGARLVSWCYSPAGIKLPDTLDKLAAFTGDTASSASATWVPASDLTAQPGDILLWGNQGGTTAKDATDAGLFVGAYGNSLRVASYNMLGAIHTLSDGPAQSGPARAQLAAALIKSNHIAVTGVQEMEGDQRAALLRSLGSGYGIFPEHPQYGLHYPGVSSVNSVIWDKSQVSFVSGGSLPMPYYFYGRHMHIPLVKLRDNRSGQQFYVTNTHDPAHPPFAHLRYVDAKQHAKDLDALSHQGLPLFFTGDFNSGYSVNHTGDNPVWQHKRQNMTWCVLTKSGTMIDGYDAAQRPVRTGQCPARTTKELGSGYIDHVYVSKNVIVTGFHRIENRQLTASDHGVTYIDANLPGAKPQKGDSKLGQYVGVKQGKTVGLLQVRATHLLGAIRLSLTPPIDGGDSGPWQSPLHVPCVVTQGYGASNSFVSFHDGVDCGVGSGTPVYAAHGGIVFKADYDVAGGNTLVIDDGGAVGSGFGFKYEHLSAFAAGIIPNTTRVTAGQLVGYSGATGANVTGPHLHFSVCTDVTACLAGSGAQGHATVDPIPFMRAHGVDLTASE